MTPSADLLKHTAAEIKTQYLLVQLETIRPSLDVQV